MVAPVARAFGIDQDVGDVLHVAHLVLAAAHFEQRIEAGGAGIGGIEQQAVGEAAAPAGGELPVLALDVVDDGGPGPAQQRRHHQAHALAGARRRHGEDVLGAVVAQVGVVEQAEHDAARRQQAGAAHVANSPPSGPSRTWF